VIDAERWLFGGELPTVWLQVHLYHYDRLGPLEFGSTLVYFSYFVVPFAIPFVLARFRPQDLSLYVTAVLLTLSSGTIVLFLLPTAPPWLASNSNHLPTLTRIVPLVLDKLEPDTYQRGYEAVGANDVASMPSFHVAETVLVALAIGRWGRAAALGGSIYVMAMSLSLVFLGEHYFVDALAGLLLASVAWVLALMLLKHLQQPT
jgi:membrane-associated phospholipid phosphatase